MGRTSDARPRVPKAAVRRRSGLVMSAVRPLVAEIAAAQGLVVWDVAFTREAGSDVLRVALDRRGGVDSEAIASFAETLSRRIDEVDAVPGESRYVLEVTSPGAERRLRTPDEFGVCVGRPARVTFRSGREPVEGTIVAAGDESVTLELAGGESLDVPYSDVSQARLTVPVVSAAPQRRTR